MTARLFKGAEYLITDATKDEVFTPEDFTEEQHAIADTADQFVAEEVTPSSTGSSTRRRASPSRSCARRATRACS